jgi:predicted RNA-binding Zn-ribbon protein involved in translation (DUF1610 family)
MKTRHADKEKRPPKASAHVCPQCGFAIDLKNLGLREGATGLVTCPKCDWSGHHRDRSEGLNKLEQQSPKSAQSGIVE